MENLTTKNPLNSGADKSFKAENDGIKRENEAIRQENQDIKKRLENLEAKQA